MSRTSSATRSTPQRPVTRRAFLGTAAAGAAAALLPSTAAAARRVVGANEDLRVAVVGVRSRGKAHIDGFRRLPGVRVVALCDVDRKVLERRMREFEEAGESVRAFTDVRDVVRDPDVDVVSIATQNHWHALMAIWACQHGKDVYVEKPVSHNVWEGRQLVRAAEKYARIVQAGTQSRSNPGLREAIEWTRAGHLGALRLARGLCYKPRPSIGRVETPTPVPEWIDYDLWCGPAPLEELHRRELHYDWHWVWATGNGDLGNQGIHQMDMCRWVLGEAALAPSVSSFGGRLGYEDDGETPNTLVSVFDYAAAPLVFEVRGLPRRRGDREMPEFLGTRIGCIFHCEDGYVAITRYDGGAAFDARGRKIREFAGGGDHFANFVEAVRRRDPSVLNAPIVEGHVSSALCHMGNVSYRVAAAGDGALPAGVQNRAEAAEAWWRTRDHLLANGVDLGATPVVFGERLEMDPTTEWFVDHEPANRLAKGTYRPPFVVPDEV